MTVLELFLYIMLAILLQIAAVAIVAFYRHWRNYQTMKSRLDGLGVALPDNPTYEQTAAGEDDVKLASWSGFRDFRVARKEFEDSSHSICSFHLEPVDGFPLPTFQPGQFLTFQVNIGDPVSSEPKPTVRCYSLSDGPGPGPHPGRYRISIKRVPSPDGSPDIPPGLVSNHFHDNVQEDDVLQVRTPGGHFFLQPGTGPIVLIAGGIGITPILSMLNTCLLQENSREIWLFYGVRNSTEHIMKRYLQSMSTEHPNLHLHVFYSRALPGDVPDKDYDHDGHVDITRLRQMLSLKPYQFYICGPRVMMETLVPALDAWGVPEHNVHYEAFGPASLTKSTRQGPTEDAEGSPRVAIDVTFAKSGKTVVWDGSEASLLELAEKNGISVSSGCRAGGCGSCQTPIEEGEVEYLQDWEFEPDPGCCLLCISRPKRDLTLQL